MGLGQQQVPLLRCDRSAQTKRTCSTDSACSSCPAPARPAWVGALVGAPAQIPRMDPLALSEHRSQATMPGCPSFCPGRRVKIDTYSKSKYSSVIGQAGGWDWYQASARAGANCVAVLRNQVCC